MTDWLTPLPTITRHFPTTTGEALANIAVGRVLRAKFAKPGDRDAIDERIAGYGQEIVGDVRRCAARLAQLRGQWTGVRGAKFNERDAAFYAYSRFLIDLDDLEKNPTSHSITTLCTDPKTVGAQTVLGLSLVRGKQAAPKLQTALALVFPWSHVGAQTSAHRGTHAEIANNLLRLAVHMTERGHVLEDKAWSMHSNTDMYAALECFTCAASALKEIKDRGYVKDLAMSRKFTFEHATALVDARLATSVYELKALNLNGGGKRAVLHAEFEKAAVRVFQHLKHLDDVYADREGSSDNDSGTATYQRSLAIFASLGGYHRALRTMYETGLLPSAAAAPCSSYTDLMTMPEEARSDAYSSDLDLMNSSMNTTKDQFKTMAVWFEFAKANLGAARVKPHAARTEQLGSAHLTLPGPPSESFLAQAAALMNKNVADLQTYVQLRAAGRIKGGVADKALPEISDLAIPRLADKITEMCGTTKASVGATLDLVGTGDDTRSSSTTKGHEKQAALKSYFNDLESGLKRLKKMVRKSKGDMASVDWLQAQITSQRAYYESPSGRGLDMKHSARAYLNKLGEHIEHGLHYYTTMRAK